MRQQTDKHQMIASKEYCNNPEHLTLSFPFLPKMLSFIYSTCWSLMMRRMIMWQWNSHGTGVSALSCNWLSYHWRHQVAFLPLSISVLIWSEEGQSVSPSSILWTTTTMADLCPVPPGLFLLACTWHVPSDQREFIQLYSVLYRACTAAIFTSCWFRGLFTSSQVFSKHCWAVTLDLVTHYCHVITFFSNKCQGLQTEFQ